MTDQECNAYFEALSQHMTTHRLEWVITQVQEQIRFGRLETRRIKAGADLGPDQILWSIKREPLKSEEFSSTKEYDAQERLKLLIDALERALVVTAEMESVLVDKILLQNSLATSIVLIRTDEANREPLVLSRTESLKRRTNANSLGELLTGLREVI